MNAFNDKRILIVEDNGFNAKVTATILNNYGYHTEVVVTGEEAVEKVCGSQCPDLILMDIELGQGMDGAQAARAIQQFSDVPVVFLTAHTEQDIMEKIRLVTAYGSVVKGTGEHVLVSAVDMALQHSAANSQAKLYQWIFENSLHEIYLFQPETLNFMAVNRGARENLGYTSEELSTMTPLDIKPEFDRQSFRKLLEPLIRGEQEQISFNTVHRRKDGSLYPVEVNLQLFDYRGEKLCLALIIDLSERRAMEEELRDREAMLSAIMGSARDAIVMLAGQGKVVFWNPAAEQIFGFSREEILGKDLHRLVVPDESFKIYQEAFHHFELTGEGNAIGKTIELKAKHKDGRELDVELSLAALKIRDAWHAVGIVRDIGERKQVEEELQRKSKLVHTMLQAIPNPAWLITRERRILAQNEAAKAFGASEGDYCWQGIHDLNTISPAQRKAFQATGQALPGTKCYFCRADEAMAGKKSENSEVELDGVIWDTWWVPVDDNLYLHYTVDVTKYKKMEGELHRQAITDPLTKAYNRRYFVQILEQEIERARRTGLPFSIIMFDLDHFKSINDRFGHAAGDLVLKSLVDLIQKRIRKIDILTRWGGEEFILLLPDTPREGAVDLAEEMRRQLINLDIPGVGRVTASFGVVGSCAGDTVDSIVMRADNLLYEAKSRGRNCVRSSGECL
ncbi:hypothetical protein JCM15765_22850 [Paradesulfitobacterium aromaticivorans]